jgi:agmatinase
MIYNSFLQSETGIISFEEALFHIIPVPFEKTVSYGSGTKDGPAAIIEASQQLEIFNGINSPSEKGIHTKNAIKCDESSDLVIERIRKSVFESVKKKKVPIVLGGEHTVTFGSVLGVKDYYGDFGILHFDAHADLRDSYENSKYSHACVMRRIFDEKIPFIQIGTRSYSPEEKDFRFTHCVPYYDAKAEYDDVVLPQDFPDTIYITIDIDVFDSSLMPATGTPEPGGMFWYQFFELIERLIKGKKVIGFDLAEYSPIEKFHAYDYFCARLIYNLMGLVIHP